MRIVIDAMGTDAHPVSDVAGAVLAASDLDAKLILVGDETQIKTELAKHRTAGLKLEVLHAPQHVTMDDKPGIVGKAKPGSSMHIGMNLVRDGHADAFVTMGNTGAAQAIAMLFTLRRIAGVKRPALSVLFKITGRPVIFLDIGANTDCRPDWMVQFAVMGSVYAQKALGLANPRIALLANGEEEGKGSQLVRDTGALLRATSLNFIGNAEPTDLFQLKADVVVCDGFTGNILVKTFEGATRYLGGIIREEIKRSPIASLGGLLIAPAMRQVRKRIDTAEVGGAPLLGVNGVVIIGHGRSSPVAVKNAIFQARDAVKGQIIQAIERQIAELPAYKPALEQE